MRRLFIAITAIALLGPPAAVRAGPEPTAASTKPAIDPVERSEVIDALAAALEANYVFPDTAARYARTLRTSLARGAYEGLSDPTAFADKVTADLQAVAKDAHLRLAPRSAFAQRSPPAPDSALSTRPSGPPGLEEAKMIGRTAYLRFNAFPDERGSADRARRFLLDHADAKAVIIDCRPNRGGGLGVMDAILPLLYPARTVLVRTETRVSADREGPLQTSSTLVLQKSAPQVVARDHMVTPNSVERRLQRVPVYYLTSSRTASAAEHLALALKRTHRAVLVGETTRGAGHFGGLIPIGDRFAAFIPVGRTFDPKTGWDWEGRGVAPDVPTRADDALSTALRLIDKPRPGSPSA